MEIESTVAEQQTATSRKASKSYWTYVKRQYLKNKLAVYSLYFVYVLVFIAVFADFLANEKPVAAKYQDTWYFPVFKQYMVDIGLADWPAELRNVQWQELEFDFALWTPIPYKPQNLDMMNARMGPFEDQFVDTWHRHHWMGTDNLGRDILAGMIHATRISLSVGVVAMGIAGLIGILLGSIAGYFGDEQLRMSRGRLWGTAIFALLGCFYAFSVRGYALQDAMGNSVIDFLLHLFISLFIFALIVAIGYWLTNWAKQIPWLARKVAMPVDILVSRVIEIVVTIPVLFLIVFIVSIAEPSIFLVMAVIGLTSWTGIARFIRAELLRIRSLSYIEAAHALGFSDIRILLRHGIPNSLSPVMIAIAFGIASAILIESILSFLGLGVPSDTVTWGSLLSLSRQYPGDWWLAIFPGFAIFITVTVFNLIAAGLTDALDPRMKQ